MITLTRRWSGPGYGLTWIDNPSVSHRDARFRDPETRRRRSSPADLRVELYLVPFVFIGLLFPIHHANPLRAVDCLGPISLLPPSRPSLTAGCNLAAAG